MTPLPLRQIVCVLAIQLNEALQINVLYPFLVFAVEGFGFSGSSLGVHAGILASSFCAAQFCTSIFWGRLSDKVGLKPCLIAGTIGSAVAFFFFGLSQNFTQAVLARAAAGFLNGNVGILKSFLAQISDNTNRSRAFSYLALSWGAGVCIAPILGGNLVSPADTWPVSFRGTVFESNPIFCPVPSAATVPRRPIRSHVLVEPEQSAASVRASRSNLCSVEKKQRQKTPGRGVCSKIVPEEIREHDGQRAAHTRFSMQPLRC